MNTHLQAGTGKPLLEISDLRVAFPMDEGTVRAVDGVSLSVAQGKVLGIVGESGSGKSVTAQAMLRIIPRPGRIEQGQILLHRSDRSIVDVARLDPNSKTIREIRGGEIAMIFQEPMSSFSPFHTVGSHIIENVMLHRGVDKRQARDIAVDMLHRVGIANAERRVDEYAFELSGGMRQRAMIALALAGNPSLLIADEPTTALDVTIQAQILRLMKDIQRESGMAIMFISHDLGVIARMADEIAVMYLGRVVEQGPTREIFRNPKHPYTVNLLKAIPRIGRGAVRLSAIAGRLPSPFERPTGCAFHPRCPDMIAGRCDVEVPANARIGDSHTSRCFLHSELVEEVVVA